MPPVSTTTRTTSPRKRRPHGKRPSAGTTSTRSSGSPKFERSEWVAQDGTWHEQRIPSGSVSSCWPCGAFPHPGARTAPNRSLQLTSARCKEAIAVSAYQFALASELASRIVGRRLAAELERLAASARRDHLAGF